jgi:beta-glucosidase
MADNLVHSSEHQALSLEAAKQSMVLLKNENNLLPLDKSIKTLAVIGPNANEREQLVCRYGPANAPITTVLEGLQQYLPNTDIRYAKGCDIADKNYPESEILPQEPDENEQSMINEAVEVAKECEVVILVLGGNELTVREERSRTSLDLPGHQLALLKAVLAVGKPVALVMVDGRAAAINYAQKYVPAILHAWFPGEFMGQAIAQTLFGENNPGGKLPVTFPKSVGQIPFAFPFKPGSDTNSKFGVSGALYPFGYGLSYTTFSYSNLKIDPVQQGIAGRVTVTCDVTNTGNCLGDEVVQLYLNDVFSSVITYEKVLRGFERIRLQPGETQTVTFSLGEKELGLWNLHNEFVVESGKFEVMVGSSSQDIRLKGEFEIVEN